MNRTIDKPDQDVYIQMKAFSLAERLKRKYPKGLCARDLGREMNATIKEAVQEMYDNGFYSTKGRYSVAQAACMITRIRYDRRKDGIRKRI